MNEEKPHNTAVEIIGWILLVVSLLVGFGMTAFAPI